MSLSDREILELNELCNAVVDENTTEPQRARLETWLLESADARIYYVRALDLSASLAHQASEMQMEPPDGSGRFLRFVQSVRWRWIAMAAAVLLGVGFWMRGGSSPQEGSSASEPIEYVARITGENAVVWSKSDSELKPGAFLRRGQHVELASGLAEITFDSGAVVLLSGPTVLELNSAWDSTLRRGAVKVHVPSQAIGFRVSNSAVDIVDVGTEFSMVADGQGGADVLVLKGEVQALPRGREDPDAVVLHANESRRFAGSGVSGLDDQEQMIARFSTPVSLDRMSDTVKYAYWSFDELTDGNFRPKLMGFPDTCNLKPVGKTSAAVEEAMVKGIRNRGLKFDGELIASARLPGLSSNSAHTVAFWTKVPKNAQLSDAYSMVAWRADAGKLGSRPVHIGWNRNPSEGPLGAVRTDFSGGHAMGMTPLRDGRWHHICVIFLPGDDPETPVQVKQYVDGKLESNTITPGAKRSIGGNVGLDEEHNAIDVLWLGCRLGGSGPKRERFRGEIDELFVADRGLEPAELVQLMDGIEIVPVGL